MDIYANCLKPHLAVSTASCRFKCKCPRCKAYLLQKSRKYKQSIGKEKINKIHMDHYRRQRQELNEYKKTLECFDCGYNKNYALLEFHHLTLVKNEKRNCNPRFLIKEHKNNKTVCLCPTCHAERHFNPNTGMIDLHFLNPNY